MNLFIVIYFLGSFLDRFVGSLFSRFLDRIEMIVSGQIIRFIRILQNQKFWLMHPNKRVS